MLKYQKSQIADVARILAYHDSRFRPVAPANSGEHRPMIAVAKSFADLFAADNPPCCVTCRLPRGAPTDCPYNKEHTFAGGFDREQFLAACGLESEG